MSAARHLTEYVEELLNQADDIEMLEEDADLGDKSAANSGKTSNETNLWPKKSKYLSVSPPPHWRVRFTVNNVLPVMVG